MSRIRRAVRPSLIALVVVLAGILAVPVPPPGAAQASCETDVPETTIVSCYFDAINQHDFRSAYSYLSPELQRAQPYREFVALFDNLAIDELNIDGLRYRGADTVVFVRLARTNTDGSMIYYVGTYTVRGFGPNGNDLRIAAHELTQDFS